MIIKHSGETEKKDFLKEWPIERLKNLTLEEYSNINKKSFVYGLEVMTSNYGGIGGGAAYKFGVFRRQNLENEVTGTMRGTDNTYSWLTKYGASAEEVFLKIKAYINDIVSYSQSGDYEKIEGIDLGNAVKWKIAVLYSDGKLVPLYSELLLQAVGMELGLSKKECKSPSKVQRAMMAKKNGQSSLEFASHYWEKYSSSKNEIEDKYKNFLKHEGKSDKTISNYVNGLKFVSSILVSEEILEKEIYELSTVGELKNTIELLGTVQKYIDRNKSGNNMYSGSIDNYLKFMETQENDTLTGQSLELPGAIASHGWLDNGWTGEPTEQDIKNNKNYGHVSEFGEMHEAYNFDYEQTSFDKILGYSPKFNQNVPKNNPIVLFLSSKRPTGGMVITGVYAFPEFNSEQIKIYNIGKYAGHPDFGNFISETKNVVRLDNFVELQANYHVPKGIAKTGYNTIETVHTKRLLDDLVKANPSQEKLLEIVKSLGRSILNHQELNQNQEKLDSTSMKNTILYGPPGTGKTYNTVNRAIEIVDPNFYKENENNQSALKTRFDELLIKDVDNPDGQIGFCTFHQSFGYEDFVEGIKPKVDDATKNVYYETEDGIFKALSELASSYQGVENSQSNNNPLAILKDEIDKDNSFFKIALGSHNSTEGKNVTEYGLKNNKISVGYGGAIDYTNITNQEDFDELVRDKELSNASRSTINNFVLNMKEGDIVFLSKGNFMCQAIGRVTAEGYSYDPDAACDYSHFRGVEWLYIGDIPVKSFYTKNFVQGSLYHLKKSQFLRNVLDSDSLVERVIKKDFILIIDEINRGNVSSIFGELITLIEDSKRQGEEDELSVLLPYSKKEFTVPNNLHILGTMNTADKSVEALDTALRRRFSFDEMMPEYDLVSEIEIEGINLGDLLKVINKRIKLLLDREHQIGHAYLLGVKSVKDLQKVFSDKITPLLQEYFYGDYGKIGLVLGASFVTSTEGGEISFAKDFAYDEVDYYQEKVVYELINVANLSSSEFITGLTALLA